MVFLLSGYRSREWVNEVCKSRQKHGEYHHLFPVLKRHPVRFFQYTRMSVVTFEYVLQKIRDVIEKQDTNWRRPIGAAERLVVTLRYVQEQLLYVIIYCG